MANILFWDLIQERSAHGSKMSVIREKTSRFSLIAEAGAWFAFRHNGFQICTYIHRNEFVMFCLFCFILYVICNINDMF